MKAPMSRFSGREREKSRGRREKTRVENKGKKDEKMNENNILSFTHSFIGHLI